MGLNLREIFRHGVVSILPVEHEYSALLSDFRPLAFEGNTFRVREVHLYHYLERIALARENLSYPGDRRVLLENVFATFEAESV